ncbi:hypothetical protein D9M70_435300 [compost metagenome]
MQDPVGEDVTALEIAGKLHFVDRHEGRGRLARHRFDGADRIAGAMRSDLLLASDQRDIVMADPFDQARIDLARQEAQRQAYDAAIMRDHALDRVVRLAGIGWPEHRGYAAAAQDHGVNGHVIDPGHSEITTASFHAGGKHMPTHRAKRKGRRQLKPCSASPSPLHHLLWLAQSRTGTAMERIGDESKTHRDSLYVHDYI